MNRFRECRKESGKSQGPHHFVTESVIVSGTLGSLHVEAGILCNACKNGIFRGFRRTEKRGLIFYTNISLSSSEPSTENTINVGVIRNQSPFLFKSDITTKYMNEKKPRFAKSKDKRTFVIREDFGENDQGFNFYISIDTYENRIREVVIPESIFVKILDKSRELKLQNLSKMEYYGGRVFPNKILEDAVQECENLEKHVKEKTVLKYIIYIKELCNEALKKGADFHEIGL